MLPMIPSEALVVDASVAAKWHLTDQEHTDQARLLLTRFAQGKAELVAPDYIRYEVPFAITVATQGRQPRLTQQQGQEAIEEFLSLANRLNLSFIIADRRFYRRIQHLPSVIWIGDYSPAQDNLPFSTAPARARRGPG